MNFDGFVHILPNYSKTTQHCLEWTYRKISLCDVCFCSSTNEFDSFGDYFVLWVANFREESYFFDIDL